MANSFRYPPTENAAKQEAVIAAALAGLTQYNKRTPMPPSAPAAAAPPAGGLPLPPGMSASAAPPIAPPPDPLTSSLPPMPPGGAGMAASAPPPLPMPSPAPMPMQPPPVGLQPQGGGLPPFEAGGQTGQGSDAALAALMQHWNPTNKGTGLVPGVIPMQILAGLMLHGLKGGTMPARLPHFARGGEMGAGMDTGAMMPDMQTGDPQGEQGSGQPESELLAQLAQAPRPPGAFLAWLKTPPDPQAAPDQLADDLRAYAAQVGDGGAGGVWQLLLNIRDEEPNLLSPELTALTDPFAKGGGRQMAAPASGGGGSVPMPPGMG